MNGAFATLHPQVKKVLLPRKRSIRPDRRHPGALLRVLRPQRRGDPLLVRQGRLRQDGEEVDEDHDNQGRLEQALNNLAAPQLRHGTKFLKCSESTPICGKKSSAFSGHPLFLLCRKLRYIVKLGEEGATPLFLLS